MATPTNSELVLAGEDAYFINSGDNKIIVTGQTPVTVVFSNPQMLVGSATLTGAAPSLVFSAPRPDAGSLALAGQQPFIAGVGGETIAVGAPDALSLSGQTPFAGNFGIPVGGGAIAITELTPERKTGLKIVGFAPSLAEARTASPTVGSITVSPQAPQTLRVNEVSAPKIGLFITGSAPNVILPLDSSPSTGSVVLTGKAPALSTIFPGWVGVVFSSSAPVIKIENPGFTPGVTITPVAERGTTIQNLTAGPDADNRYTVDDQTGFKVKPGDLMQQWDNTLTTWDHFDKRHPADLIEGKREAKTKGAIRPDDTRKEVFIDDPVSADDL